ncbi:MAG: hypothetical protein LAT68_14010 [Cyclobacteriaceae bacterium]|nr:hypothetical protein [Cyclobacteriaceae bacterium]MCH8517435.1 hypothetical protein [Cyclobacteriaceae bacterium]
MAKKLNDNIQTKKLSSAVYQLFDIFKQEKSFLIFFLILFFLAGILTPYPHIAMWFGFMVAGYSAIANDSIQTIGTFIASNSKRKWYFLWLFIGLIFVATVSYSWIFYDGDVSHGRLQYKGFDEAPTSFSFLQLSAPLILLILTRLRMPVSTTFLLLNVFTTEATAIGSVIGKSLSGYVIAFVVAIVVWTLVAKYFNKYFRKKKAEGYWIYIQWFTSGALWSVWIMQDAANIAIFLPRQLSLYEFLFFTLFIFFGLGLLFYFKGDKIQQIVDEKSGVTDVRAATVVDFIYAIILFVFKTLSNVPMSTTWVFLGLLGGRELAIALGKNRKKKRRKSTRKAFRMVNKDLMNAGIGLLVSLILALMINEPLRDELKNFFQNLIAGFN